MPRKIYHERQTLQLCALHTLNNLFQEKDFFTKTQLDEICLQLDPSNWRNPHRSNLGLGNYDINVIMTALQQRDYDTVWFDKRREPSCLQLDAIFGLILNVPSGYRCAYIPLPFQMRHWIAIRRIDGQFYNLDSKLDEPLCIGGECELLEFLGAQLQNKDRELFVIVPRLNTAENNDKTCATPAWIKQEQWTNASE